MKTILEKFEIESGEELVKKFREVENTCSFDRSIKFTTEEIYNFLIKKGYKIYVIDIEAMIYEKVCYDQDDVRYENPKPGVAQTIVALSWKDEVPTKQDEVSKYDVYNIFDRIMKKRLLNL